MDLWQGELLLAGDLATLSRKKPKVKVVLIAWWAVKYNSDIYVLGGQVKVENIVFIGLY